MPKKSIPRFIVFTIFLVVAGTIIIIVRRLPDLKNKWLQQKCDEVNKAVRENQRP